ncbi:MAG: exodeoxyribonuclease VII large subunit [Deltaproteobacteria bacterium]|nr:MAG: exodeoxyribonuclease VII large subunit [Deltaproteobacteria bacterium]
MDIPENLVKQKIYSVSQLNAEIKELLENSYPFIWISGETSNFYRPVSGHFYFTLKDENSQISAVMFRGQNRNLKFDLEDGMQVTGMGRISVYEPRGTYQIIFEYLEPEGIGALQVAFEQLKARLSAEGLFDEAHKKPLPFLPQHISLITSTTGAVVHDMLNILDRRFPNIDIEIIPVKVQGYGAEDEIVAGLNILNSRKKADVAILARGGGSLEDLQAFNSESVARAIFDSTIPIISAVGHETDFTITDFVADLRAPTPSAAAELVVPLKAELSQRVKEYRIDLKTGIKRYLVQCRTLLREISARLVDPRRKIYDFRLRIDDTTGRLYRLAFSFLHQKREQLSWRTGRLFSNSPANYINTLHKTVDKNNDKLLNLLNIYYNRLRFVFRELTSKLAALNPTAILARGYSITRTLPDEAVVRDARSVKLEQNLEVLLAKGSLRCRVKRKIEDA